MHFLWAIPNSGIIHFCIIYSHPVVTGHYSGHLLVYWPPNSWGKELEYKGEHLLQSTDIKLLTAQHLTDLTNVHN